MSQHPGIPSADPTAPVVDLNAVRAQRRGEHAWLVCPDCDLTAGPYLPAEAACLAGIHDQVMHRSRRTAYTGGDDVVATSGVEQDLLAAEQTV